MVYFPTRVDPCLVSYLLLLSAKSYRHRTVLSHSQFDLSQGVDSNVALLDSIYIVPPVYKNMDLYEISLFGH